MRLIACTLLLLPLTLFGAVPTSWVTGYIIDEKGVAKTGAITIAPQFQSMLIDTQYVSGARFNLTLTNGGFTNLLVNGDYMIVIGGINSPVVSVPGDGTTNNFIDLINTNGLLYEFKMPGAVVKWDSTDTVFGFLGDKLSFTSPLTVTTNDPGVNESITLEMTKATNGTAGYLSSADWITFNSKQSAATTFSGYGISDTSAGLAGAVSDETGTGGVVLSNAPAIRAPIFLANAHMRDYWQSYHTDGSTLAGYFGRASGIFTGGANDSFGVRGVNKLLLSANNANTPHLTIETNGTVTLAGTTNHIVFGATNTAPVSDVSPTRWISVQVAGESAVYRIPLFE